MELKAILLGIAIISVAIYILPSIYAMFPGEHTFYAATEMDCLKCHEDVGQNVNASQTVALQAHKRAANNTNYTTYLAVGGIEYNATANESYDGAHQIRPVIYTMDFLNEVGNISAYDDNDTAYFWNTTYGWENTTWNGSTFVPTGEFKLLDLDADNNGEISIGELCALCHNTTLFDIWGTHTAVTVRVCDDDRCHSNANYQYNDLDLFDGVSYKVVYAGKNLSMGDHREFYLNASEENSTHLAGTPFNYTPGNAGPGGVYISLGFWTCLGCHSETELNITWIHPTTYMHDNPDAPKQRYQ